MRRATGKLIGWMICTSWMMTGASADHWPNWRGPGGDGVATADAYPTDWSQEHNVAWKLALAGPGSSTPAVWDQRIFVTHGHDDQNATSCFDFTGRRLWSTNVGSYVAGKHKKASGCNSSPVSDGKHVYVYFKSGDLACLDVDGHIVWQTNLQREYAKDTLWWDLGTSPVVTDRVVIVAVQQDGPSFLVALDKNSGQQVWKQDRTFDVPRESDQSYTTPVLTSLDGQQQVIVLGADHVTGHSVSDGSEVWRVGNLNPHQQAFFRSIASPLVIGDMLIAPYARGNTLTGIRLGGQGDVSETHVAWTRQGTSSDVPTPANLDGQILICTDKGKVLCLDPEQGDELWSIQLPKSRHAFSSSPIVAGQHIYCTREDGTTFVLDRQGELVATNELDELVVATPVFARGHILIRGREHLYCIKH